MELMELRLDRIIREAESIRNRLEAGEKLSSILPQVRLLAEINGDVVQMAWLDCEIYGLLHVPFLEARRKILTLEEQQGISIFAELHKVPDLSKMDYKDFLCDPSSKRFPQYTHELVSSIGELEQQSHKELEGPVYDKELALRSFQAGMAVEEGFRIVRKVKDYVYEYIGRVWLDSVTEKDNQALLGPDHRIVINHLDALETGVGQELMAALDNLRSPNPANWSLAAVGCRTVITKLGNLLWKVPSETYYSNLGQKELEVGGDKEKNRLFAYIDYHHQYVEEQEHKDMLKQLHGKVWAIYKTGSKGKRGTEVRHEEAKTLVVDTFELVGKLHAITGLVPLEAI